MIWRGLSERYARWRIDRAIARRPIDDGLWRRTLRRYPFLRRRDPSLEQHLRALCSVFLDTKEFTAVSPMRLRNDVVVAIAAQACLPVLRLGLERYAGFVGIVVHSDQVVARRQSMDDDGLVHEYDEVLAGEAMAGGPLMLSWRDVRGAGNSAAAGYNVVIHEFAHVLDMEDGVPDGLPILPPDLAIAEWAPVMQGAFEALKAAADAGVPSVLDPYGTHGPEEFFAVASECFFVAPHPLREAQPALYAVLKRFYRQDPAEECPALP